MESTISNTDNNSKQQYYIKLFRYLYNNKQKTKASKKEDEEFYYADVEGTRSQFTKAQMKTIQDKYDIPISTKIVWSIVEQMLAFITGSRPYSKVIASSNGLDDWAKICENLNSNVWYESNTTGELRDAWQDMFTVGEGFIRVRENNFYNESTFGVVHEYVPWTDVYIDPASRRKDMLDADYICIAKARPIIQLEQEYGITIDIDDTGSQIIDPSIPNDDMPNGWSDFAFTGFADRNDPNYKRIKWSWIKEFFEKKVTTKYFSPEGYISYEHPTPVTVPNVAKQQILQQINMAQQSAMQQAGEAQAQSVTLGQKPGLSGLQGEIAGNVAQEKSTQQVALQIAYQKAMRMPDYNEMFNMKMPNGQVVQVAKYAEAKEKTIIRTLQIDKKIIKQTIEPCDAFSLINFPFTMLRNHNRTYGVTHYIKDIVKALNKLWGLMIYDFQLRSSLRVLAPEGSIQEPKRWESQFAVPGSINTYTADPSLGDGGKPEFVQLGNLNTAITQLLTMLVQLAEYITGIYGVLQGNPESAPSTFGATQTLQSFGTQRIKLTARSIEAPLAQLTYVTVKYLQKFCPTDKIKNLLDISPKFDEVQIFNQNLDTKFKVRTEITNSLPTSRQMFMQLATTLAGQTQDANLQKLLTEYALKFMDMVESDELLEKINVVEQMGQQMGLIQQQLEDAQSQVKQMQQQSAAKDMSLEVEKAKGDIKANAEKIKAKQQLDAQSSMMDSNQESEMPPTELNPDIMGNAQAEEDEQMIMQQMRGK